MKKMKKLFIIIAMLISIFSLTGCVNEESALIINDDDTSTLTFVITLDKDKYELLSSYGIDVESLNQHKNTSTGTELDKIDALFQETAAQYADNGFAVTPVDDTVEIGFKAYKTYMTIEDLNKDIQTLYSNQLSNVQFEVNKTKTNFNTEYKVYGTIEYVFDKDINLSDPQIEEDFIAMIGKDNLNSTFTVTMPPSTSVSAHDGTFENNTFKWIANGNDSAPKDVHIISSLKNTSAYAIAGVVIALLLGVVALLGARLIKKYKDRQNSTNLEDNDDSTYQVEDDDDIFEED